jgi:hypothetical protein
MKPYKCLTLIAAIAITALELVVFARASVVAPQLDTLRTPTSTQIPTVIAPSIDQTGDAGSVSGE